MSNNTFRRIIRVCALAWLCVMLAVAWQQWSFWQSTRIDTNIMSLLPKDDERPAVQAAIDRLAQGTSRQVVILVGAKTWSQTQQAVSTVQQALRQSELRPNVDKQDDFNTLLDFYRPWRNRLLTPQQVSSLAPQNSTQLGQQALQQLFQPAGIQFSPWQADPLGLWPAWWAERLKETPLRMRDGQLWLHANGQDWVLLRYQTAQSAFSTSGENRLDAAVSQAKQALQQQDIPAQLIWTGIPRYAEAAAVQAHSELSTIGLGSMIAVLIAVWLCFRSLQPVLLVLLSLLAGSAAALCVTSLIFERVHILTLVFGSSLIGVAVDYGLHYFAARQGQTVPQRWAILQSLLPGMWLALLTSVIAYLTLAIAPFPGLRQMAVFSAVGLSAAFITVACWFPWLDRRILPDTAIATRLAASLPRIPRLSRQKGSYLFIGVLLLISVIGLFQLHSRDDLRQLQNAPATLIAEQKQLSQLLALPSPAQFFLVAGNTPDAVLSHEEQLTQRLNTLVQQGQLTGYHALSNWVPSAKQQAHNARLSAQLEQAAWQYVKTQLGEAPPLSHFAPQPLTLRQWLAGPQAEQLKSQWLGQHDGKFYSVVYLRGLSPHSLPAMAQAAQGLKEVQWVDKTADISDLMARYRTVMAWLLLLGYIVVLAALTYRYGRAAWRAYLPTLLGSLLTVALLSLLGQPLQLFVVLALLLLLGMGVDYGIFLLEHPHDNRVWLAVILAASSTLLSFGLLALSATPALRTFGLTMLLGIILIWMLTPMVRPPLSSATHGH